jgi:hypothetical protein
LAFSIKLKPERFAKGCQRAFGSIRFCRLECDIVDLSRGSTAAFTRSMAFSNNGGAIGVHSNPNAGDVDGEE